MTRKILAGVFLLLALLALAGCSKKETASPAAGYTKTAEITEKLGGWGAGWFEGRNFSTHYDIEWAGIQIDDAKDYNRGDEFPINWNERFNITWDITSIAPADWAERIRVWINSGDAPEWMVYSFNHSEFVNYAEQGLIKKLPDDWKSKYPNLARSQSFVPLAQLEEENLGGTYALLRPLLATHAPMKKMTDHITLAGRADWGRAAGYPLKPYMKISEVFDYARAVKKANPGKVPEPFYPLRGMTTNTVAMLVMRNFSWAGYAQKSEYYKGRDGKYHWGPADPKIYEALKMIQDAYKEGLIYPEFYTTAAADAPSYFNVAGTDAVQNTVSAVSSMVADAVAFATNLGVSEDQYPDTVQWFTVLGEDGLYHEGSFSQNFWGANIFSSKVSDAEFARYLEMLDYSTSDEGQYECQMGVVNVDWKIGADGQPESLLQPGEILYQKRAMLPITMSMQILWDDFQFVNPGYPKWARDLCTQMYIDRERLSNDETALPVPDQDLFLFASREMNQATYNYAEEYSALIVAPGNLEDNWKKWVADKMPMIQPVLDQLNAMK
jgi:putative aldouronate transport system substrate-binding protein